ncbi:LOW QUALITY PROTEIN: peroxidasin [Acyrthosiphon pisum]|uniref:Ig-like domain-containing protein n=1 Tax=Acyrthosiphon pisum TaxID=7029 RepID=A0A8R2F9S5_ACYPI|nr:LOW QUALITY PROTEIN: peroxidasin [Acyrthosiphon pisum]|eukprot:XP_008185071.1 PREDICTED: LOW QUALITY PROTEIN: peroxidasin [Acyrthosiphon pisum]
MTRPMHHVVCRRRVDAAAAVLRKTMVLLLLLLVFSLSSFPLAAAECPAKCMCFKTTVRCMFLHLDRIPDRISPTTTVLDLRFNKIKDIEPKSLAHLTELNTLLLNNNNINDLKNGAFANLSKLRLLYLYKNKIENIETRVFNNLTSLEQLYLHFNKIYKLDLEMFKGLTKLDRLFLHNNKIRKIPPGTFDPLTSLGRLRLDSNLLTCDCDILWLVNVLKKSHTSGEEFGEFTATCHFPVEMSGKSLMEMTENDFHCNELRFKEEPNDVTVSFGGSAFFTCKVEGNQNVKTIWTRDNNEIDMTDSRYSMTNDGLMIKSASLKDVGTYECMVKKENVELKSRPAKIILESSATADSPPEIIMEPGHKTVSVGEQLQLACEAVGVPEPSITWAKDDINLELGQRVQVFQNNTLTISKVERTDVGHYKCVASNYLGRVSSEAMVNVNAPPVIVSASRDITVKTGSTVELQCLVEGYPKPVVTWFKDGRSITPGPRTSFHNERTTLRVEHAKEGDRGMFTCLAQNLVGSAESNIEIKVRGYGPRRPKLLIKPFDMEAPQRTSIEVPCKADGDQTPNVTWTKDGVDLVQDQNHKINSIGSLRLFNISFANSGVYECTAKNIHGQESARGTIAVLGDVLEQSPGDRFVNLAFREANLEVDRAVNATINSLFGSNDRVMNPEKLMRMSRFPDVFARDVAKSADIFERTLANVRKHVQAGLKVNLTENFSYRDLLSVEQLDLIANLSGCLKYQTKPNCSDMCFHTKYRTIDGTCNNLQNPLWGSSHTQFRRILKPIYENGFNTPIGWTKGMKYYGFEKPGARLVSTSMIRTNEITSDEEITHMVMQWGQFLDHDLDHAIPSTTKESWEGLDCKKTCAYSFPCFPMDVPPNDDRIKNRRCMDFIRSSSICGTDTTSVFFDKLQPREQINQLTAFIDGSQIYGFTNDRSFILREVQTGFGLMRGGISSNFGKEMLPIAGAEEVDCRRDLTESDTGCYLAGDIRANEQVGLLAMHTIWIREHNRIARELRRINPHWEGDVLFHEARKIVGAELQHITFKHWMPYVLGPKGMDMLGQYQGYDPTVDPSISNVFATAALRFGHSIINPVLSRLDDNFTTIPQGDLSLGKAFFTPWRLSDEGGTDPLMRGFFAVPAKRKMPKQNLNDQLIDHLFTSAHAVSLDLAAMNIQRSRDHGIPGYTEWRTVCNMSRAESFDDLKNEISDNDVRNKLKELYGHPGNIDVWVGGILEDQVAGGKVGPLFQCLLVEQFKNLRNGDRFWYENPSTFSPAKLTQIKQASLARVLCDNGDNITLTSRDVFKLPELQSPKLLPCKSIPSIDLRLWFECNGDCPGDNASKEMEELRAKDALAKVMNMTEGKLEGLKSVVDGLKLDIKRLKRELRHLTKANNSGCYDETVKRRRREGRTWVSKKCTKCECRNSQILCKSLC